MDGVIFTYPLTGFAAYATHLAVAADDPTGIIAAAEDMDEHIIGYQGNQIPGTGFDAEPASSAAFFNYYRQAVVVHLHCIKGASLYAAAQA